MPEDLPEVKFAFPGPPRDDVDSAARCRVRVAEVEDAEALASLRLAWAADALSRGRDAWGYLGNLFVVPQHRGHGVGRDLIAACTTYADAHDFARVVLAPSEASIPLYERADFGSAAELMVRHPESGE